MKCLTVICFILSFTVFCLSACAGDDPSALIGSTAAEETAAVPNTAGKAVIPTESMTEKKLEQTASGPESGQSDFTIERLEYRVMPGGPSPEGFGPYLFSLEKKSEEYEIRYRLTETTEDAVLTFTADNALMDDIVRILEEADVLSWDGFSEEEKGLYDGESFYFSLLTTDGKESNARGYGRYPEGYRVFSQKLNERMQPVYEEKIKLQSFRTFSLSFRNDEYVQGELNVEQEPDGLYTAVFLLRREAGMHVPTKQLILSEDQAKYFLELINEKQIFCWQGIRSTYSFGNLPEGEYQLQLVPREGETWTMDISGFFFHDDAYFDDWIRLAEAYSKDPAAVIITKE